MKRDYLAILVGFVVNRLTLLSILFSVGQSNRINSHWIDWMDMIFEDILIECGMFRRYWCNCNWFENKNNFNSFETVSNKMKVFITMGISQFCLQSKGQNVAQHANGGYRRVEKKIQKVVDQNVVFSSCFFPSRLWFAKMSGFNKMASQKSTKVCTTSYQNKGRFGTPFAGSERLWDPGVTRGPPES